MEVCNVKERDRLEDGECFIEIRPGKLIWMRVADEETRRDPWRRSGPKIAPCKPPQRAR